MLPPGISRRLAELIEATFPEKIQLRRYDFLKPIRSATRHGCDQVFSICPLCRQARELKAAAEAAAAPLLGKLVTLIPLDSFTQG